METNAIDITREFENAKLGDLRLTKRLVFMGNAAAAHASKGLPEMMGNDAALEGTYRFLNNPGVTFEEILRPHTNMTIGRCSAQPMTLVVHDTSKFKFGGEIRREGLGVLPGGGQGFFGHYSLAVRPGEAREVLGVTSVRTIFRNKKRGKKTPKQMRKDPNRESLRWVQGAQQSEAILRPVTKTIHVMDREADSYEIFSQLVKIDASFIIRLQNTRSVLTEDGRRLAIRDITSVCETQAVRTVTLSRRGKRAGSIQAKIHPSREERFAILNISSARVTVLRGDYWDKSLPKTLELNIVDVSEVSPPQGEEPVRWRLVTTEPIDTVEQVLAIVDAYRSRWVIEEFFKSIKTGCAYEKRQLESKEPLLNLLAILSVVAWRLLRIRSLARLDPERPASEVLTSTQLRLLQNLRPDSFSQTPTVYEVFFAIAQLGGFLKRNGEPGWLTLGRGFEVLLNMEMGWLLAKKDMINL